MDNLFKLEDLIDEKDVYKEADDGYFLLADRLGNRTYFGGNDPKFLFFFLFFSFLFFSFLFFSFLFFSFPFFSFLFFSFLFFSFLFFSFLFFSFLFCFVC